ncbi:MAG TPA: hypothetical protein VFZ03_04610, partial [Dongiaceae bacterium]
TMSSGEARPFATRISPKLIIPLFCHSSFEAASSQIGAARFCGILHRTAEVSAELRIPPHLRMRESGCNCLETRSNAIDFPIAT